jgi:hypothetical protein
MKADIQYIEGKAVGLLETAVHLISVGTCETKAPLGGLSSDGGENMVLKLNGAIICDSRAEYRAESVAGHGGSERGMEGMISNMKMCLKSVDVKKGDKLSMEANYDMKKHPA